MKQSLIRTKKNIALILAGYLFLVSTLLPLYMRDGYHELGESKFLMFLRMTICLFVILLPFICAYFVEKKRETGKIRFFLSVPDFFLMLYLVALFISFAGCSFKSEAFWGTEGWRIGLVTRVFMVVLFMLYEHFFFAMKREYFGAILTGFFMVIILGFFNHAGISLFGTGLSGENFISTIGNSNWYCGFLSVFIPVEFVCFLEIMKYGESTKKRGTGIVMRLSNWLFMILTIISAYTAGSESIWLSILFTVPIVIVYLLFSKGRLDSKAVRITAYFMLFLIMVWLILILTIRFQDSWGNGRGGIWSIAKEYLSQMNLFERLWGIGPDCFYAYGVSDSGIVVLVQAQFGNDALTNAHCSLLTLLIEQGAIGVLCIGGFVVSLLKKALDAMCVLDENKEHYNELFGLCLCLILISYLANNMVSFGTITSSVFVAVFSGVCSAGLRVTKEHTTNQSFL